MQTITHFIGSARLTVAVAAAAVGALVGLVPHAAHAAQATCDVACSDPAAVSSADLVTLVAIALGEEPESACTDLVADGPVTVDDITVAIGEVDGCEEPQPVCGNGVKEGNEECDTGGRCFGTGKAGQSCKSDLDCGEGNGICEAGVKGFWACSADAECPGSRCLRCKTVGGDGCAANCTLETSFEFRLNPPPTPGISVTTPIPPRASGSTVWAPNYVALPYDFLALPTSGSQTLVGGTDNGDGLIPFVVRADSVKLDRTDLTVSCLCVRGAALKTCGGTLNDKDGKQTPSCTPGFKTAPADCAALRRPPCTYVYGEGNSGVGVVGCEGLPLTDLTIAQERDVKGNPSNPVLGFSGQGGPGSAVILNSSSIGSVAGPCKGTNVQLYGNDKEFCTADDPSTTRGDPGTVPQVTGKATASWTNLDNKGQTLTKSVEGKPFVCLGGTIDPADGGVVTAFPQASGPSPALPNDAVVTSQFFAQ